MNIDDEAYKAAEIYAEKANCDVMIYNGEITPKDADAFVLECRTGGQRRKNLLLIIVTPGGSADAAYRLGRWMQTAYADGRVAVWVTGWCKSAGTLLAIAGHDLIVSDDGELGPLDVQLSKSDELFEWNSGLTIDSALNALEARAMSMFESYYMRIMTRSRGRVTFKTATNIASNMVVNLLNPVYSQIDPIKIGENAREMSVASDYGVRLNGHSQNLKSRSSLSTLVQSYCSHGFVIDRKEANGLFERVNAPDDYLMAIEKNLGELALVPSDIVSFGFLSARLAQNDGTENETEECEPSGGPKGDAEVVRADFGRTAKADDTHGKQAASGDGHAAAD